MSVLDRPRRLLERLPDQARTLYSLTLGDGIRPDVQTEHTTIADEPLRTLRRYGTEQQLADARSRGASPVLLLPPPAVSARCYDLSPETSLVAHLLDTGRIPYVLDHGATGSREHRRIGFEDFFDDIIPQALVRVAADHGSATGGDAHAVDLAAWSLGGTISLLTAAARPDLPIRSVTAIGTPLDYSALPGYPLLRAVNKPTGGMAVTAVLRTLGGIPAPAVRVAYRASAWQREIRKPAYILSNIDDHATLARMEVIDRFQDSMLGYTGRMAGQMWGRLIFRDELATGVVTIDGAPVDLTSITVPIQLFGSHRDAIVSWDAARHGLELFGSAEEVHFTTVETSHLGLIAGADAAEHTWPRIDAFYDSLDARGDQPDSEPIGHHPVGGDTSADESSIG
ncbi:alpha/beta hydrolase [Williamsia sterculiae]|uniref:Polyhydroxyalkanoate synthase n=1 Tax=Williamsia sterculiae TaxID=1344003 RepID=A0A1N7EIE2_9NOCA|nr:alpha/beta hydrolase [Williamsia sterculiae]SIR87695.1 polyhydroxyalkanoate synthase [Williamsia sterculiae]